MEKDIQYYLSYYLGCRVQYKRFNEELQNYEPVVRVLTEDCLLTIKMLYGEFSLIDVQLILRPLSDMSEDECAEYNKLSGMMYSLNKVQDQIITAAATIEYLLEKQFDVFSLVHKKMAIFYRKQKV